VRRGRYSGSGEGGFGRVKALAQSWERPEPAAQPQGLLLLLLPLLLFLSNTLRVYVRSAGVCYPSIARARMPAPGVASEQRCEP
jgi:hypothetical protein